MAQRGGKRPGAGRKAGTVSAATQRRREVAEQALAEGVSPLDIMLTTMRGLWDQAVDGDGKVVNFGKAMQANMVAKDAAPFIHPKLSAVEATGPGGGPIQTQTAVDVTGLSSDQLRTLASIKLPADA